MCSRHDQLGCPPCILLWHVTVSQNEPKNEHDNSYVLSWLPRRSEGSLPLPVGSIVTNAAKGIGGFHCCKITLFAYVQFIVQQDLRLFSTELLPRLLTLSLYQCVELFHYTCETSHFLFTESQSS